MKLPIPITYKDKTYSDVELKRPTPETISESLNVIESNGNSYQGVLAFVNGVVESIIYDGGEVSDPIAKKSLLRKMPYKSCELVAIESLMLVNEDDGVEGFYPCPRCNYQVLAEQVKNDDGEIISDNLDYLSELNRDYADLEGFDGTFTHTFLEPTRIMAGKEEIEVVESVTMHYTTIEDCINAFNLVGEKNKLKLQFAIYSNSIEKINGKAVEGKFKSRYGDMVFSKNENLKDLGSLFDKGRQFGLDPSVKKRCPKCSKEWFGQINPMNFFGSALQSLT
jgi:hypothetical protein